jgi:2-polyprenyl-3-methyl-5-hydroxy-6-metoxy-1,4-benzoquinol methylase
MIHQPCIVCAAEAWTPLYQILLRCGQCGFIRAQTELSTRDVERLYGPGYFQGEEYGDYLADALIHLKNSHRRLKQIASIAGQIDTIYEIGCAYGFWLQTATQNGIRAAGIDVSPEAVRYASEVLNQNAALGSFEDAEIPPGRFQAFCMWDTIEHLVHPNTFLAKISSLLPRSGWFFATTGDIASKHAQRSGPQWRMIHPPTHLQYFSTNTMSRFLQRHGLQVVSIKPTPMYRSVYGTLEGLKLFGKGPLKSTAKLASIVLPRALTRRAVFSLDIGDIMFIAARKI